MGQDGNIWGRLLGFIRVLVAQWVGWAAHSVQSLLSGQEWPEVLPEGFCSNASLISPSIQ